MPGRNCCVVNCGSSRYHKSIGIFQLPSKKENPAWRKEFLAALTETRVKDVHFQELIEKNHVYTCEKHFFPQEMNIRKYKILFC